MPKGDLTNIISSCKILRYLVDCKKEIIEENLIYDINDIIRMFPKKNWDFGALSCRLNDYSKTIFT